MKKISFDFDSTLNIQNVQDFAHSLKLKGVDIWVYTSRFDDANAPRIGYNDDLYLVTDKLGIPKNQIIFTNMDDKLNFLNDNDFVWHLDDDWTEIMLLNKFSNVKGISHVGNTNWKNECKKLLNIK